MSDEIQFTWQASPNGALLNVPINPALSVHVFIPLELMKAMSRDIAVQIKEQQRIAGIVSDVKRGA